MDKNESNAPVSLNFKFKIDIVEYAKRFGINLPDDSSDVISDDSDGVETHDSSVGDAIAEDATVSVGIGYNAPGSLAGQCQATLAQCKAKNPMTCRYHGAQVISNDIENEMRKLGVNGNVNVELLGIISLGGKQYLSIEVEVDTNAGEEKLVEQALANFGKNPGVELDPSLKSIEGGKYLQPFEIDMLDPKAKAKWGAGQNAPAQTTPPPQQVSAPAASTTPVAPKKPRPTRKRTKKADLTEAPVEKTSENPAEVDISGVDVSLDPDAPTLYPDQAPPKPPDWNPPFDANELVTLKKYAERIGKTAERLDGVLEKEAVQPGHLAQYLAKGNGKQGMPYSNLPVGLQKWKNEVDVNALRVLAAKDPDGQVKKMLEVAEMIVNSEKNGWKDKIGVKKDDVVFKADKYQDPYAKERAAYESYKPGSSGRESCLAVAKQVESSKVKDAPKEDASDIKVAADEMSKLEDGFKEFTNAPKNILKVLGQAYYSANEKLKKSVDACKKWLSKQTRMQSTIAETVKFLKENNLNVPDALTHSWSNVEDSYEDAAWRYVASRKGLSVEDKANHMAIFKPNMKAVLTRCPIQCCYNHNHIRNQCFHKGPDDYGRINGNNNSYVETHNAAFGTHYKHGSSDSKKQIQAYGIIGKHPLCDTTPSEHYTSRGGDVVILLNPKKAIIGYVNQYLDSRYPVFDHTGSCNITYANNPTCTGVALGPGDGKFGNTCGQISKISFTEDYSHDKWESVIKKSGLGGKTGEAYAIGGCNFDEGHALALKDFYNHFSDDDVKKFNDRGITILNGNGEIRGKNLIPDDPDLQALVWGTGKPPKFAK